MKRITLATAGFCVLAASQAIAQTADKQAVETTTKQTLPGVTLKSETQSVSGTVKEYEAGKSIKLSGPDDKSYSFDLNESARVEGKIVVGQMANVHYTKGTDGKKTVTVLSEATANAVTAAEAPKLQAALAAVRPDLAAYQFSNAVAARPSMPGSCTSMRIKSGWSVRASVSPVSASTALITLCPALRTSSVVSFMFAGLSSMIRMRPIVRPPLVAPRRVGPRS